MSDVAAGQPGTGILGTGSYLPEEVVPNGEVARLAGVTEEWILRKTGIHRRHRAAAHEATSDLAVEAARAALDSAGITADQLGWVVVATSTPDHPQPATACLVQHRIGAVRAAAFDLNASCSGFVFALVSAAALVAGRSGTPGYALVVGADVYSRIVDPTERRTAVLFGDGAGAVVLGPASPGRGIVASDLTSHGGQSDLIRIEAGGSRRPASEKTVADGLHTFRMDGRGVRDFVTTEVPLAVRRLLEANEVDPADVDHLIPHQANGALLTAALPLLGLPRVRLHLTVAERGNTGAASIPLTLDDCRRKGCFRDGDVLLLAGFGGGMSVGTVLLRWG
jgi:3-oxoacyl-[acyl-carrier-protein] synthase-3